MRRDDQRCQDPGQGYLGLCRISHVRLEVTDLAEAADWYRNTLGLVDTDQVPGDAQLTLAIPETPQLFILREVPEMTQRSLYPRGPHVDIKVAIGAYDEFVSRLTNIERYWSPFGDRIPWHEPDTQTVYFYDPFGNPPASGREQRPPALVWCLTNTLMKMRGHFGRRQGAMTSRGDLRSPQGGYQREEEQRSRRPKGPADS